MYTVKFNKVLQNMRWILWISDDHHKMMMQDAFPQFNKIIQNIHRC